MSGKVLYGAENPALDAHLEGMIYGQATANDTTQFEYYFGRDYIFNGIQFYAWDSNKGDNISLSIEYWNGASWARYKKFGKSWYVTPNHLADIVLFPSKPTLGTRLVVEYTCGATATDFMVNGFKFISRQIVKASEGEEGEDW